MRHIISVLVENKSGVLTRVAGLFSGRGFNIDSLAVGQTHDPSISRMTIVVNGKDNPIEQLEKQLNKLIDVIKVQDLTQGNYVDSELVIVKVNANDKNRSELLQVVDIFKANIIDIAPSFLTIEFCGADKKVNSFLDMLKPFGIKEVSRTGKIALSSQS